MSLSKIKTAGQSYLKLIPGFLIFFVFFNALQCKDVRIEGIVGSHIVIEDTLAAKFDEPTDTIIINGLVQISNPTLFFIDSVVPRISGINYRFEQIDSYSNNNSNFTYFLTVLPDIKVAELKIRIQYCGEILAGSDSLCSLAFRLTKVNGLPMEELNALIVAENIGGPLPYLRFPYLTESRYFDGKRDIKWQYWFDQDSDVELTMYDIGGRARLLESFKNMKKGIYDFTFTPDYTTTVGLYFLMLTTNTGFAVRPFIVTD